MAGTEFQILCQVCGKPNAPEAEYCSECNAKLQIRFRQDEEEELREAAIERIPAEEMDQALELERQIEAGDAGPAIYIQLSGLYLQYTVKDRAVEVLQRAIQKFPDNDYLRQRLEMVVRPGKPQWKRIAEITESEKEVTRWVGVFYAGVAVVVLLLSIFLAVKFIRPSTYRVWYGSEHTVSMRFSPDGKRLAFLLIPKYGMMDLHPTLGEDLSKVDSKLMVAGPRGKDPKALTGFASYGLLWGDGLEYHWIPARGEIAYTGHGDNGPEIHAVDTATGNSKKLADGSNPTFSHDGKYMAYLSSVAGTEPEKRDTRYDDLAAIFSRVTRWSLFDYDTALSVMNLNTGEINPIVAGGVSSPHFSPTSYEIVYQRKAETINQPEIWDPNSGESYWDWADSRDGGPVISADIYKIDARDPLEIALTSDRLSSEPQWTPDGEHVVYKSYEDPSEYRNVLMIMRPDGGAKRRLLGNAPAYESFGRFSFSHDGRVLAFEGQFVNPSRPDLPTVNTPFGAIGGGKNIQTDIFLMETGGAIAKRFEEAKHKFKTNPVFHPRSYKLSYEIVYVDGKREAWVTKVRP